LHRQKRPERPGQTTEQEALTKFDKAPRLLSEIYNWFSEGFDTKDLQEVKALLEELKH
jgi:hypothetical protein